MLLSHRVSQKRPEFSIETTLEILGLKNQFKYFQQASACS